ncbi:ribosome biogenesis protein [Nanoarchaeota archaeon]|nr:MAG: ribosome biogenesis protein [Nanoarchaeota archaeon]
MRRKILYCEKCKIYTLREVCKFCGGKTIEKKPMKFSLQDQYAKYRRRFLK